MFKWKFICRWVISSRNQLVKQRRFFWWRDYEAYSNRTRAVEIKLNKLHAEVEKNLSLLKELKAEENRLRRTVKEASEGAQDVGPAFYESVSIFKPKYLPEQGQQWLVFQRALNVGRQISDAVQGGTSFKSSGSYVHPSDLAFSDMDSVDSVGSSMPIAVRNTNKQQNNKQQQNSKRQNNN